MTGSDVAQIITALGVLVTALAAGAGVFVSLANGRRAIKIGEQVSGIKEQTDGINAKLVKVTGEAEFAKGVKQGEDNPKEAEVQKVEIVKIPSLPQIPPKK